MTGPSIILQLTKAHGCECISQKVLKVRVINTIAAGFNYSTSIEYGTHNTARKIHQVQVELIIELRNEIS